MQSYGLFRNAAARKTARPQEGFSPAPAQGCGVFAPRPRRTVPTCAPSNNPAPCGISLCARIFDPHFWPINNNLRRSLFMTHFDPHFGPINTNRRAGLSIYGALRTNRRAGLSISCAVENNRRRLLSTAHTVNNNLRRSLSMGHICSRLHPIAPTKAGQRGAGCTLR